jgi:hypothetical protein
MSDFDELPLDPDNRTRPIRPDDERPQPPRSAAALPLALIAIAVAVAFSLFAWFYSRSRGVDARPAAAAAPVPGESATAPAAAATPARPLPPLDASDAFVREAAALLSTRAELASWLAHEGLVRRYVAVVANVAEGASPAPHVGFLRPAGGFTTLGGANEATVDPASFRRHDLATAVFTSLDTAAAARLHRELTPLIDIAWSEIGEPGRRFDDVLATAIGRLVAVQVPDGPVAVVADGAVWQYADPALAALPAAEKHLLRLGPDNARAVQAKLRELAAALGLSLP